MSARTRKFMPALSVLMFSMVIAPAALAQCGLPTKPVKPTALEPFTAAGARLMPTALDESADNDHGPSIVGMWHVLFTAHAMNGQAIPDTVIDNSIVIWHSDGTEIMNSSRPAQDGNFCLGVWERTGNRTYSLNHIPWQGNDPSNAPGGIGNPQGGAQLTDKVRREPAGNAYTGSFTLTAYDTAGNVTVSFTGTLAAKRVTTHTAFGDLL